ncbi:MAG: TrmH family RNA methyltransferase [Bacteroidota bacterium]
MLKEKVSLVLDTIQDPGNLGTIIRIADWFGVDQIICSNDSADVYNPQSGAGNDGQHSKSKYFLC